MFAYPFAEQAQTIYYNKSKLTADDVKTWDGLTAKGVLATDFTNAHNFYPVFLSAGTQLYGKTGETVKGTDINSAKGEQSHGLVCPTKEQQRRDANF